MPVIEHATVEELGGSLDVQMRYYPPNGGRWTIRIATAEPFEGYHVWAEHDPSGAVVPTESAEDGMSFVASKDHRKTLAQARDRAGRLATILRGTMHEFDWRKEATRA